MLTNPGCEVVVAVVSDPIVLAIPSREIESFSAILLRGSARSIGRAVIDLRILLPLPVYPFPKRSRISRVREGHTDVGQRARALGLRDLVPSADGVDVDLEDGVALAEGLQDLVAHPGSGVGLRSNENAGEGRSVEP